VNRTDLRCLDLLFDGPLTTGELARRAGLSAQAITTAIDRIERAGYAERIPDASDRRRVTVRLTPTFTQAAGERLAPLIGDLTGVVDKCAERDLVVLVRFLAQICEVRESHVDEMRGALPARAVRDRRHP
jgi:DNA-binding MarR family transcriptional regulator